jgi:hypothetical protein
MTTCTPIATRPLGHHHLHPVSPAYVKIQDKTRKILPQKNKIKLSKYYIYSFKLIKNQMSAKISKVTFFILHFSFYIFPDPFLQMRPNIRLDGNQWKNLRIYWEEWRPAVSCVWGGGQIPNSDRVRRGGACLRGWGWGGRLKWGRGGAHQVHETATALTNKDKWGGGRVNITSKLESWTGSAEVFYLQYILTSSIFVLIS